MTSRRVLKVASAIREVVSMTILTDLKDPRVENVTVTYVEVSGDLREDLIAGNMGGGMLSHAFVAPNPFTIFEPAIIETMEKSLRYGPFPSQTGPASRNDQVVCDLRLFVSDRLEELARAVRSLIEIIAKWVILWVV